MFLWAKTSRCQLVGFWAGLVERSFSVCGLLDVHASFCQDVSLENMLPGCSRQREVLRYFFQHLQCLMSWQRDLVHLVSHPRLLYLDDDEQWQVWCNTTCKLRNSVASSFITCGLTILSFNFWAANKTVYLKVNDCHIRVEQVGYSLYSLALLLPWFFFYPKLLKLPPKGWHGDFASAQVRVGDPGQAVAFVMDPATGQARSPSRPVLDSQFFKLKSSKIPWTQPTYVAFKSIPSLLFAFFIRYQYGFFPSTKYICGGGSKRRYPKTFPTKRRVLSSFLPKYIAYSSTSE